MTYLDQLSLVVNGWGHPKILRPLEQDSGAVDSVLEVKIGEYNFISILGEHPAVELPIDKSGTDHGSEGREN